MATIQSRCRATDVTASAIRANIQTITSKTAPKINACFIRSSFNALTVTVFRYLSLVAFFGVISIMTTRILLAGVLGAIAMFIWSFIGHDLLPLGEAGIRELPDEGRS